MGLARQRAGLETSSKVMIAQVKPVAKLRSLRERFAEGVVEDSVDLRRIMALPRRTKAPTSNRGIVISKGITLTVSSAIKF